MFLHFWELGLKP